MLVLLVSSSSSELVVVSVSWLSLLSSVLCDPPRVRSVGVESFVVLLFALRDSRLGAVAPVAALAVSSALLVVLGSEELLVLVLVLSLAWELWLVSEFALLLS